LFCWCPPCPHHVLAWFRTKGGGGAPWLSCLREERGMVASSLCLILLNKKLRETSYVLSSNIYCSCTIRRSRRWFWTGGCEVSLLTKWEKTLHTFRFHSDASHLPTSDSTPKPNLAMDKPHVGLSNNHLNPVYMITDHCLWVKRRFTH
jgi:hypothetical protein